MRHEFDPEKAIEAIIYVAKQVGGDMYLTLKLLYLADKVHLERYGSLLYGERYAALPYGPVPSSAYNIVKYTRGDRDAPLGAEYATEVFGMNDNTIVPKREPDLDVFSKSDVQALDAAVNKYGHLTFGELKRLTHDDAYHATITNGIMALDAIASTLPNAADLIQHLSDPHPGEAERPQ